MKKVLIVEDDSMLSEIYKKKFEKAGSFEVVAATSGTDAIKKAKEEKPDLVLLDLVLPEMDGFDVLAELKKDPSLKNTKVVPFSNLSEEDNDKRLNELGADGFIAKSEHTPQELVVEVEKILNTIDENKGEGEDLNRKGQEILKNSKAGKILIIDEEEVFLEVFGGELEKIDFNVVRASSGKEGLDLLSQKDFDLVVLGSTLSDKKGSELIKEFKSQKNKSKTKFIALKNEDVSEKDLSELKELNVKNFIEKDKIEPKQFAVEIKNILG